MTRQQQRAIMNLLETVPEGSIQQLIYGLALVTIHQGERQTKQGDVRIKLNWPDPAEARILRIKPDGTMLEKQDVKVVIQP